MLIVLEMANNHQGSLVRGCGIVDAFAPLIAEYPQFQLAVKFQYRDPSILREGYTSKLTERVASTMLSEEDRFSLINYARKKGFLVGCTPFDEASVLMMRHHGFNFLKIASCSLTDWPLLESIAKAGFPVIASTGGATMDEVAKASQFLSRRVPLIALMHCVAEYPTPANHLNMNRIDELKKFGFPVGLSTHELPVGQMGTVIAASKCADVFEWHVDIDIPARNSYSLNTEDTRERLKSISSVSKSLSNNYESSEKDTLLSLRRGVWAARDIKEGEQLSSDNVTLQLPAKREQMLANDLDKYSTYIATRDIAAGARVTYGALDYSDTRDEVRRYATQVVELFKRASVTLPSEARLVLSHHFGLANFAKTGCGMVEVIRQPDYAKKLIAVLPGQKHPPHRHIKKVETFNILSGDLHLFWEDKLKYEVVVWPGEQFTVTPGIWHSFFSREGCVFEEVSTALVDNDSEYRERIDSNRKTTVWLP